ncbi:trichohyalin-like isoform X2 [Caloenas nicobarica]|uniref:trichohyalin-like isoform X2 n=1 Tax=Caloenas nicobarica TaxID=187106 RepID=UPI0032B7CB29
MAAGPPEVLERDLGCPEATDEFPKRAGKDRRKGLGTSIQWRFPGQLLHFTAEEGPGSPSLKQKDFYFCLKAKTFQSAVPQPKDADGLVSSDRESSGAHGLEEARAPLGISEQDLDEPELSMPEPALLGADKKAAEKKRVEKVGVKGSAAGPPVPKSLPVQRKVEPPGLDPTEEPLLWEGLTLNKCILVASVVALLSVTFQVLQAPCSREGVSPGRQDPPPPPLHEVVSAEEEEVQEVVTAQPAQLESSMFEDDDGDGDDSDDDSDDDGEADSNLAEPWIFKKWFGRSTPEDEDEEPVDVPEVPPAVTEVKKSQEKPEKKPEKTEKEEKLQKEEKEEKAWEKPEKEEKEDTPEEEEEEEEAEEEEKPEKEEKTREKKKKKEEKARERRAAQEWSSRREARAKDRALGDKPGRALRAPREPEQPPQKKRGREGKERRRERDEPRREGWKGRPGRAEGGRESPTRDWRQHKGRRPWEPAATPGREGTARHREGKRRD